MTDEERFERAMRAATPSARDDAFVLAVLERAEIGRYRAHTLRNLLRGAGAALALVGVAAVISTLAPVPAMTEGLLAAAALTAFIQTVRRAAARA